MMKTGLEEDISRVFLLYIQPLLNRATQAVIRTLAGSGVLLKVAVALCIALWTWRIWRFTIDPALHPERPKEMPYWIPFLGIIIQLRIDYKRDMSLADVTKPGHTISFVRDSQKTLDRAK